MRSHSENKTRFKISASKEIVPIRHRLDCNTRNVLYVVVCQKCPEEPQYIGKTKRTLKERGREHLANIEKLKLGTYTKPVSKLYNHFTTGGHSDKDFLIFGIEEIFGDDFIAMTRERHWITIGQTVRTGLNTYRT